tara:strand:+ start:1250 stop:1438 length:189 start_codon:yes stop_codon:yes gene_type:complete
MSIIEFVIIILVFFGIFPKKQIIKIYKTISSISKNENDKRRIIGDDSIEEEWSWIEKDKQSE